METSLTLIILFIPLLDSTLYQRLCEGRQSSLAYCTQWSKRFSTTTVQTEVIVRMVRGGDPFDRQQKLISQTLNESQVEDEEPEDPSCSELRGEYGKLCFRQPPLLAFVETKAFCDAFVKTCQKTLTHNFFSGIKGVTIDYTAYCRRNKERFEYVCPEPLRFPKYVNQTTSFCVRFSKRCPGIQLPSEPIPFNEPKEDRIYTREIKYWCDRDKKFARNFCTNKDVLKLPSYALRCAYYKKMCIDTLTYVIYGWG